MTDREIDSAIAFGVMRWRVGTGGYYVPIDGDENYTHWQVDTFRPSEFIGIAWEVKEKIGADEVHLCKLSRGRGWYCRILINKKTPIRESPIIVEARADTDSKAMCLAALKAVEGKP